MDWKDCQIRFLMLVLIVKSVHVAAALRSSDTPAVSSPVTDWMNFVQVASGGKNGDAPMCATDVLTGIWDADPAEAEDSLKVLLITVHHKAKRLPVLCCVYAVCVCELHGQIGFWPLVENTKIACDTC